MMGIELSIDHGFVVPGSCMLNHQPQPMAKPKVRPIAVHEVHPALPKVIAYMGIPRPDKNVGPMMARMMPYSTMALCYCKGREGDLSKATEWVNVRSESKGG